MDKHELVENWRNAVLAECRRKLGRDLTRAEEDYIALQSRFIALETVEGSVKSMLGKQLDGYLKNDPEGVPENPEER